MPNKPPIGSAPYSVRRRLVDYPNPTVAIPKNPSEAAFIKSANKGGLDVKREQNGDLNARPNFPPGWTAQRAWNRQPTHKFSGLA